MTYESARRPLPLGSLIDGAVSRLGRARSITGEYAVVTGRVDRGFERSGSATVERGVEVCKLGGKKYILGSDRDR
jgi:hypothetical protein